MKPRTKLFLACALIGYIGLFSFNCFGQSYKIGQDGKVIITKSVKAAKQPDKLVAEVDGVKYYQGAKGGVYCWKVSKKTGQQYKAYLKKED